MGGPEVVPWAGWSVCERELARPPRESELSTPRIGYVGVPALEGEKD